MQQLINKSPRIEAVDALRGFAVMAILLVHNQEHFIFPVYPTDSPEWLNVLDQSVFKTIFSLFAGKAYAIFALLFGFTFYIQTDNCRKRGKDFGYRFLWRMILLVGFATLNAAFFPAGDVLLLFAVVSLVLFLTRNFRERTILILSIIFLMQPMEWYHYIAWLVNPSHTLPDLKVGEMYTEVGKHTLSGDFSNFIWCNITLGQKASLFWAINAGRAFQTAGLFLLGFYLGRKQMFVLTKDNQHFWTTMLVVSAVAFAPLLTLKDYAMQGQIGSQQTIGTILDMWQKLAFTLVLISSFLILYNNSIFRKATGLLRFYGKMSLTNYIAQSVTGALIYFPIGLYLAPYCGNTTSLLIGVATFILQALACRWWLARHKQGPLEHIWHKWTWVGTGR